MFHFQIWAICTAVAFLLKEANSFSCKDIPHIILKSKSIYPTLCHIAVLAGNDPFLTETSHKTEKDSKLIENIWYFDEIKSFWKLISYFCFFFFKFNFGMAHNDHYLVQTVFGQIVFRTAGLQLKLLSLIESPNIFHGKSATLWKNKETGIVNRFFHILQEVVVIEISEWKLKIKIARNTTFEGNQN